MESDVAEANLRKWFWTFKEMLVDRFPQNSGMFDFIVEKAYKEGFLYECMEFSYLHLEIDSKDRGGMEGLTIGNYISAINFGYRMWNKPIMN